MVSGLISIIGLIVTTSVGLLELGLLELGLLELGRLLRLGVLGVYGSVGSMGSRVLGFKMRSNQPGILVGNCHF